MARREFYVALLTRLSEMRANAENFVAEAIKAGVTGIAFDSTEYDKQERAIRAAMERAS